MEFDRGWSPRGRRFANACVVSVLGSERSRRCCGEQHKKQADHSQPLKSYGFSENTRWKGSQAVPGKRSAANKQHKLLRRSQPYNCLCPVTQALNHDGIMDSMAFWCHRFESSLRVSSFNNFITDIYISQTTRQEKETAPSWSLIKLTGTACFGTILTNS